MRHSLGIGTGGDPLKFQLRGSLQKSPRTSVGPRELAVTHSKGGKNSFPAVVRGHGPRISFNVNPRAAFLTQQISQEVVPKGPGLDRISQANHAYAQARDINLEVLSRGPRLKIKI